MFLEELKLLENKKNKLEKKDIDLIISDFDDTIFSTDRVIKNDYRKGRRWDEWNQFLKENPEIIKEIIEKEYNSVKFPKTIFWKLRLNHDLILTKWIPEFQPYKLKATWCDKFNHIITDSAEKKIIETINYVVNNLWFIPNKITVYEDRPEYFIKHRELIESFLNTKLEIMFVEMNWNENEPKITEIKD